MKAAGGEDEQQERGKGVTGAGGSTNISEIMQLHCPHYLLGSATTCGQVHLDKGIAASELLFSRMASSMVRLTIPPSRPHGDNGTTSHWGM